MRSSLTCIKCNAPLILGGIGGTGAGSFQNGEERPCPGCGREMIIEVFPALFRPVAAGSTGETLFSAEEAACFYHPQKRALVPCDSCGRFLCALCDVELNGRHLCPNCLQTGRKKGKLRDLENERVRYDRVALTTSVLPLLFWPATLISAPAALYLSIRHWNSPPSLVQRYTKVRFVVAILFSLVQVAGWATLFGYLIFKHK